MTGFSFSQFSMPSSTSSPFSSSSSQQSQGFSFSNLSSSSPSPSSSAPASSLFSSASQPQQTSSAFSFRSTPSFFSSPAPSTTSGFSFGTSAFGSSLTANPSSTPSTVTTSNLFPSSAPNLFSGSQPSSASKFSIPFGFSSSSSSSLSSGFPASTPSFGVASSSAASSSPAPSFGFPTSSSSAATTGSSLFGASLASSAPALFGASSSATVASTATTAPANPAPSLFGASSAAPSSASASAPTSSGLFSSSSSSSSPFSASSTQAFSFGTGSVFSKSNTTARHFQPPTPSSQPQSTASAAMFELTLKEGMGRMQVEKPDLVEVGAQSDLPAHKVNQVAGSEIVRSGPSEAEPCMERMQVENPVLEVGVQPDLLADIVNQADGSDIVRTGPEGVPSLDKVVAQVDTSAKPFDVLADYPSTEDQPVDQTMVQSTPVDTVREFEAAASFQESELNRIFLNLFVSVEGFLVSRPYVELYRKILRRYGHMATTEVLTDCPLGLVGVATEVMRLFEEMSSCTKADLSEDLLRRWDFRLSSAESLKFNVDWLRQRLEEVKSSYRHQIENANAIEAVRSSLAVTESKLTALIARREDHLKAKQAAEGILKAAEAAMAMVNATLQQDDEEISVFEAEKLGQLVKLCVVEGDFMPGVTLGSDLIE